MVQPESYFANWTWDLRTDIINGSPEMFRICGLKDAGPEIDAEQLKKIVHPDDRGIFHDFIETILTRHRRTAINYRIKRPDGAVRFLHTEAEAILDENNDPCQIFSIDQDITEQLKLEQALARELESFKLLQEISTQMIQADNVEKLYDQILATIFKLLRCDFASIQRFHPERGEEGELCLLRDYGFGEFDTGCWEWITPHSPSSCGLALKTRQRVIFPDVQQCDYMAGSKILEQYRQAGIRAVQSTPLLSRTGTMLGMISAHWREPQELTESEIRSLDVLARQTADLIERTQAEEALSESEEKYRGLFNSMVEAFELVELIYENGKPVDGIFLDVNPAWERMTGLKKEQVLGRKASETFRLVESDRLERLDRVLRTGELVHIENYVVAPNKWYSVNVWKYSETACGVTITDITERKRAEETLREADRRKDEFLAMLSHEIRNPLASIMLCFNLLERTEPGGEQAAKAMEIMGRQAGQLSRLVDDLLDVTRITRGKVELKKEHVELNTLIRRTVDDYLREFKEKGIALDFQPASTELYAEADPARITQVVGNLLHNAVKYTKTGGYTRVSVAADDLQQFAVIRVVDSGIGLRPEMLENMFTPFVQADSSLDRNGNGSGLGLGLALVKGLTELHGGEVHACSDGLGN